MDTIRLDFCDFHPGFRKTDNFFYNLLKERYRIELCDQPDFLFYSYFGHQHRLHTGVKIFFTGESAAPDWSECDYALTSHYLDSPRHLRLPLYVLYGDAKSAVKTTDDPQKIFAHKSKFCSFVVSNHHSRKNRNRLEFYNRLSKYKRIESGGKFMNNIGGPIPGWSVGKIQFMRACKFNIAFENASIVGYTTEKIFEAMQARALPIYWGNPLIGREFNTASFLNAADFPSQEALVEKIIELDQDDGKYLDYMRRPFFIGDTPNEFFSRERLFRFFERVFTDKIEPVSHRRKWFSFGRWVLAKRNYPVQR